MRKIISILLIAIMLAGMLCGCAGKGGAAESAMQLDMVQMVETAKSDAAKPQKPTVREQTAAPARITFATQQDKLSIVADADVYVPDIWRMPVCRVLASDFTQKQATAFWEVLVGDTPMVHQRERDVYTRAELEQQILHCQRQIAELPGDEIRFHVEMTPEEYIQERTEALNAEIAEYTAMLSAAPEEIVPETADGTLRKRDAYGVNDIGVVGYYDGIDAYADGICSFEVKNNPVYTRDYGERVGASLKFGSRGIGAIDNGRYSESAIRVDASTVLTDGQLAAVGITPAEAKALVEALIQSTDAPFAVDEIWLLDVTQTCRWRRAPRGLTRTMRIMSHVIASWTKRHAPAAFNARMKRSARITGNGVTKRLTQW